MTYSITISLRHPSKDLKVEEELIRPKGSEGIPRREKSRNKGLSEGSRVYSGPCEEKQ